MPSQPWIKFYPSDWSGDKKLRACSLATRGFWIELLGIAHEAEPYGYMLVGNVAPDIDTLARMTATTVAEAAEALAELVSCGVVETDAAGLMFSRRMVRDHKRANTARANAKFGGNPALKKAKQNQEAGSSVIPGDNLDSREAGISPRSQKPDTRKIEDVVAREVSLGEPSTDFIRLFDAVRADVFGAAQARPWPHGLDLAVARRWQTAGADKALVEGVFRSRMSIMKDRGKTPPGTLGYFDQMVSNALAEASAGMPTATASDIYRPMGGGLSPLAEAAAARARELDGPDILEAEDLPNDD